MATVRLKPGHVQPVWAGHPWVYAQAIDRVEGGATRGDEVTVVDPRGNFLGRGFYSPGSAIPVRILVTACGSALHAVECLCVHPRVPGPDGLDMTRLEPNRSHVRSLHEPERGHEHERHHRRGRLGRARPMATHASARSRAATDDEPRFGRPREVEQPELSTDEGPVGVE